MLRVGISIGQHCACVLSIGHQCTALLCIAQHMFFDLTTLPKHNKKMSRPDRVTFAMVRFLGYLCFENNMTVPVEHSHLHLVCFGELGSLFSWMESKSEAFESLFISISFGSIFLLLREKWFIV